MPEKAGEVEIKVCSSQCCPSLFVKGTMARIVDDEGNQVCVPVDWVRSLKQVDI